jgi:DNA-binding transcriptional regulator YdaS (Cro superfamily)
MTPAEAVIKAAQILGSQAELARRLQVKAPTVSQWCSGERPVPAARALQIEALTERKVTRSDLCPSFPWQSMAA